MSRLTAGTLVRLSRKGKDCSELRAIPRDDIGMVTGTRPDNVRGIVYRVRWLNGYYPEHTCYRHELKYADKDQMRLNKERIRSEIYASTVKAPS